MTYKDIVRTLPRMALLGHCQFISRRLVAKCSYRAIPYYISRILSKLGYLEFNLKIHYKGNAIAYVAMLEYDSRPSLMFIICVVSDGCSGLCMGIEMLIAFQRENTYVQS